VSGGREALGKQATGERNTGIEKGLKTKGRKGKVTGTWHNAEVR
jgi:hypothetical protein